MGLAKITRNNQITLTGDIIKLADLKEGDIIIEEITKEGAILLRKKEENKLENLFGILKGKLKDIRKDIEDTRKAW